MPDPIGVHLVGSVPFASAHEVFTKAVELLPGRLATLSDGETGQRSTFVLWQETVFPDEVRRFPSKHTAASPPSFECRLEHIGSLGYFEAAISSYQVFRKLRDTGVIPENIRFQICLPTPLNPVCLLVDEKWQNKVLPLYEARLIEDIERIQENIAESDLAFQFDMPCEFGFLEAERGRPASSGFFQPFFGPGTKEFILESVIRLSKSIRPRAHLGFHLCYGDGGHRHFIEPESMHLLVEISNALVRQVEPFHPISWFHMPCPKNRSDFAYYEPLRRLAIGETKLFLGLVHPHDENGTRERIKVAQLAYGKSFGISTECGMGRTPVGDIRSIFTISKAVSSLYTIP
ncbi:hypothetical protein G7Y89_g9562 [Cudoniella acicularis]|uniref:Uncharacterized protein n=1 Tax=Cudoniella acicularis TaxID=354080 RepID=A0A8H4W2G8_9HELO|nr:hypothetical protein G7Y89_g9562 [Cudoniella acicularis]